MCEYFVVRELLCEGAYLCSPGSMFPGSYVPRVPCSPGPMFPGSYVPRVPCSPGPMLGGGGVEYIVGNIAIDVGIWWHMLAYSYTHEC